MRVLVLMGGTSAEREVSLRSGAAVVKALQNIGHQAEGLDFNSHAINAIRAYAPDVVFIALHGKPGEDGTVQGLLDLLKIPYTGSGLATSAICIDKVLTKKYLSGEGIPTAPYEIISQSGSQQDTGRIGSYLADKLGMPLVVKPSTQGSSIGTLIVKDPSFVQPYPMAYLVSNCLHMFIHVISPLLTVSSIIPDLQKGSGRKYSLS
jgi:D-alanine-D-alanine ligase